MGYNEIMKKLVLISGISGAGKTTASNILEDMGYTCIDQYPVELLPDLLELIKTSNSIKYDKVALTIWLSDLDNYSNLLANSDYSILQCALESGYKSVRSFNRNFKNILGITPIEYKNRL